MLKILHYGLSTNMGGIETYLLKISSNINKEKFQFEFLDTNIESPCFYNELTDLGGKFHKIIPRNSSIVKSHRDLEDLFKNHNFDILHCHLNTLSYLDPVKVALKHNCKVIIHSRSAGSTKTFKNRVLHYLNSMQLPFLSVKKIAVSKLAGKWLFGKKNDFLIINNSVDINKFKFNSFIRADYRNSFKLEDKFVIGHIGAFLPVKNHKFIIKVFVEVLKKKPNAILLLIGTGFKMKEIKNLIKEIGIEKNVVFLGKRSDISNLLSMMDCFIFPSFFEGFPNAVIEAQTSGLPCYISDEITDEVIVTDICYRIPLDTSLELWAESIVNTQEKDRNIYGEIVQKKGLSINEEIKKIEDLYTSIAIGS